jgi:transposase
VTASAISLDIAEVEALLARIEPLITKADHDCLKSLVGTLIEVTRLARQHGATIARLRRMLGQTSSEKTANVVGANGAAAKASDGAETASEPVADEAPSDKSVNAPANDTGDTVPANDTGDAAKSGDKPRRKGHGRIAGSAYGSESIAVPHPTLCAGQQCPACAHGTLYARKQPASCVRIFGQAPLVALRWDCECLRCCGCGHVFTAPLPEQGRGPKYSESAASMMIVLRYGMGMPLHRLETMQRFLGVPVPASTQWEVARDHVQEVLPVYNVLVSLAADAPILHNDDTYVRILELMGKRRVDLVAKGDLDLPDRTGLFTTGIVARTAAGPIALFASGRQHAGENLADLLDLRDPALAPPIQMCDGLDRNLPDEHAVVLANCLAHGRRHVVDEVENHPELCAHLLDEIGKVFANDALCRRDGLSGEARLAFHQRESGPVMDGLRAWIEELFAEKRVEPNSGLGGALRYLLARWEALTLFLRVKGAPIDNNMSERSLKHAIRQRRASLFYRSKNGALVGDVYTALIVTTQLHRGDPFRYLTALFTNYKAVEAAPADWLPWNYEAALARLDETHAHAA